MSSVKKIWITLLLAACLLPWAAQAADAGVLRGYAENEPKSTRYQYVHLGQYPYEADGTVKPVLWRILDVEDNRALLLTEYVIDSSQIIFETDQKIIQKHAFRRISSYAESDLYTLLNTEVIHTIFGDDPVCQTFIEEPGAGTLFILTRDQYMTPKYGFSALRWNVQPTRQAVATPYALSKGLYRDAGNKKSPYWAIDIKAPDGYKFGLVGYDGHISYGAYTNGKVGGWRLAVRLDLTTVQVTGGDGTKESPFTLTSTLGPASAAPTATPAPAQAEDAATPEAEPENEPADAENEPAEEKEEAPEKDQAASAEPRESSPGTALISFVGDCSIGDAYGAIKGEKSYHSVVAREGYGWPFSQVKQYFTADDLTVANLEVVLTTKTNRKDIMYPLRADPEHVNILLDAGIEMVNTANNHCMDYYEAGYRDSLKYLDEAGIQHFGSLSYNKKEGGFDDLAVRDVNGIRFGFMGFSYPHDYDIKAAVQRVKKLKEEQGCQVVVVSMHWGRETYMTTNSDQVKWAKQLIDGGADLVYGHHPHVLQPMCFYKGKPILFSTGNFTFGTMSDVDKRTGIFQTTYELQGETPVLRKLQVIPCQTRGTGDYRPFEVTGEEDRRAVYKALVAKKAPAKCDNPPDSFLQTGVVLFDENGQMIQ